VIGVLALQGDYEAHARAIERAGGEACEVRTAEELSAVDGLIIPGGESTTMLKLLDRENLFEPLRAFGESKPVFGTCAGAILLAKEVSNPKQTSLGLVDIAVERNAYGRQLDSRVTKIEGDGLGEMEAVFIRAPIIRRAGAGVKVIASYNGDPVLIEAGRHLVATFHPELSSDHRVHKYFLDKVAAL
jgi:5'-phosphate synthase pdxT subunit